MERVIEFVVLINSLQPETQELWYMLRVHVTHLNCFVFILMAKHWYILSRYLFSVGAKCQILSSVAPPGRKTWSQFSVRDMSWGLGNPCFTKFSMVNFL